MKSKIWYVDINGKLIGPFSVSQLRNFPGLTPDTLVWREGFKHSIPIRNIPELREIFEDAEPLHPEEEVPPTKGVSRGAGDELALDLGTTPPSWLFALLMTLIFPIIIYHFFNNR